MMKRKGILLPLILFLILIPLTVASAENDFHVLLAIEDVCEEVDLTIDTDGGTGPFSVTIDFGDEDEPQQIEVDTLPFSLPHSYPGQGEYDLSIKLVDSQGLEGELDQTILIEGPEVALESDPFPPLLTLQEGEATITFSALVTGDTGPYAFEWDLDEDGTPEAVDPGSSTTEFTYTEAGEYEASVSVSDTCGFSQSDSLKVIVLDDEVEEEEESEESEAACHPMAEKIAQALSTLTNVEHAYTCEEIYAIFRGSLNGGSTIGFGRLWHAYQMASVIPDLTWEEIRDWKLDGSSWGALNQLNRFAEAIGDVGIRDLFDMVSSGDHTVGEIRTAMRMTLRFEADFEDALGRIADGASKGELGQFYRLAQDLELDPSDLEGYLDGGASLSEVRHAARLSERIGSELGEVLTAHADGSGWGEINQAYRLVDEGMDMASILDIGVKEYRQQLREEGRLEKLAERETRMSERDDRIAERFGEKFDTSPSEVLALYQGECDYDWSCVRSTYQDQTRNASGDRDARTLEKIAKQFGVSQAEVLAQFDACGGEWNCVRAYFRELAKAERGKK